VNNAAMTTGRPERRATMAWLVPNSFERESADVFGMTPPDVRLAIFTNTVALSMANAARFDADAFDRQQREVILDSVRGLVTSARPDFTAVTGDLIQAAMGVQWDLALRDAIRAVTGTEATTAMTAITDALTFLGARRVSVASPFRDDQNVHVRRYLEEAGFEVTAIRGFETHGTAEIRALPADAPMTLGMQVFSADPRAQAILVPCPVWRVSPHIVPLEEASGVPVLTVLNTFVWSGLRALRHHGGVAGYGRLLQSGLA
jgi:maleate cis-trans isomerase